MPDRPQPSAAARRRGRDLERTMEGSAVISELREVLDLAVRVRPAVAGRAGLSTSELDTLEHLMAGPLGPVEIAHRLGVTSAASSGIVDRLEGHGHVRREAHPGDRRRTQVVITDSGRAEVIDHLVPMFAGLADADASLTAAQRAVVLAFLQRVAESLRSVLRS